MNKMHLAMRIMQFHQGIGGITTPLCRYCQSSFASQGACVMQAKDIIPERRPLPPGLCWPDGRRIAVVFNIAYEMWSDGATSGVGPMGNLLRDGIFDPNADSYGRYNVGAGCRRLLDILERHAISASVLTSGMVAEHHPDELRKVAEAGHEVVGHG